MAGLKNDKDKTATAEPKEAINNIKTNEEATNTGVVIKNQETTETEKTETKKEDKTYIYVGKEFTKDGFILKHKGFYTSEQLKKIEARISNYDEIKENFIDLDKYNKEK